MKRLLSILVILTGCVVAVSAFARDDYNPRLITEPIKKFIKAKYDNARIVETDYDDGLLKVEIVHKWKEKNVYFRNDEWQYSEWNLRATELPRTVTEAIDRTEYSRFRIDDADYIQKSTGDYYKVELERGEYDVVLLITPDGKVL